MDINRNNNADFNIDVALGKYHDAEHIQIVANNPAFTTIEPVNPTGEALVWTTLPFTLNVASGGDVEDDSRFVGILTTSAILTDTETVTIGTTVYTFQDTLTDVDHNLQIAGTKASESLTYTGQPLNNEVVVIGGDTYTFETSLTNFDKNVAIGANQEASLDNLIAAINLAAGAGSEYAAATTAGESVASKTSSTVMLATAKVQGVAGGITSTTNIGNASWANATFQGGTDDISGTLDNLIAAIDLSGVAGTDYATSTTLHPDIAANGLLVVAGAGDTVDLFADSALITTEATGDSAFGAGTLLQGIGAHTIIVKFLDSNFREKEETISLLGATESAATVITARRVLSATVGECGVYGVGNTAAITIENSNSDTLSIISALDGVTADATWTSPRDRTTFITGIHLTAGTANTVNVVGWKRANAYDIVSPFKSPEKIITFTELSGSVNFTPDNYIKLEERTDMWWTGTRATGATDAALTVVIDMILVDNL